MTPAEKLLKVQVFARELGLKSDLYNAVSLVTVAEDDVPAVEQDSPLDRTSLPVVA